ncbi:MAG: SGNH/GDSL hydrolase family protein, partial [Planctomycetota bacterium]
KFVKLIQVELPATRIIYIGIKPSRSRWALWPVMNEANMMIKDFSGKDNRLFYFDSATPLLNSEGKPNPEFFLKDQLHLNDKGYEVWTERLQPIIEKAFKAHNKKR